MAFDNTNRGSIWKNEKKRPGKQDADFTGSLNVNGVEYWVNAWKRKEDAAEKAPALSFSIRPKDEPSQQQEAPISQRAQATIRKPDPISTGRQVGLTQPGTGGHSYSVSAGDMDDDVPFAMEWRG